MSHRANLWAMIFPSLPIREATEHSRRVRTHSSLKGDPLTSKPEPCLRLSVWGTSSRVWRVQTPLLPHPYRGSAGASRVPAATHACCRSAVAGMSTWRTSEEKQEEADGQEEKSQEPERERESLKAAGGSQRGERGPRA